MNTPGFKSNINGFKMKSSASQYKLYLLHFLS